MHKAPPEETSISWRGSSWKNSMAAANKAMPVSAHGHAPQRRCWREPGTSARRHVANTQTNNTGCPLSINGVAAGKLNKTQGMSAQWTMQSNDRSCPKLSNPTCLALADTNFIRAQKSTNATELQQLKGVYGCLERVNSWAWKRSTSPAKPTNCS